MPNKRHLKCFISDHITKPKNAMVSNAKKLHVHKRIPRFSTNVHRKTKKETISTSI